VSLIVDEGRPLGGILYYVTTEHSFKFDVGEPDELLERLGGDGVASLAIGTLQIEIGVTTGIALFVWGLHSRTVWQQRSLGTPNYRAGIVRVANPSVLQRGVSREIVPVGGCTTSYDQESGWVNVRENTDAEDQDRILIADGVVLGLCDAQLRSIWLQPVFDV
jgi:hypothetical protein